MTDQKNEVTTSKKAERFITNNKTILIVLLACIICCLVGFILGNYIGSKIKVKNLAAVENISYELTKDSAYLETAELESRRADAFEKLTPYVKKSGIVGVRANMLCAELAYQQEKYEDSADYWKAVAKKSKNNYTAPIANFNLGVCYEQLGKIDEACEAYKKASDDENFTLRDHATFSYGRVLEAKGDFKAAAEAYNSLNDRNPNNTWAKLAKTRVLILQVEGKTE